MKFIYLVGAQCTGKTTVVKGIEGWFDVHMPQANRVSIKEVARNTLALHNFTREDIRRGGSRCMELQKLILDGQVEKESEIQLGHADLVIADRSCIDPLVYARMYAGGESWRDLLNDESWPTVVSNLKTGIVIVCEPVEEWLHDDGIRLMPLDWTEWVAMHDLFCRTLSELHIPYTVIPAAISALSERINFVISLYQARLDGMSLTV